MKYLFVLLIILLNLSCSQSNKKNPKSANPETKNSLDWVIGRWERTNSDEGKKTYESWTKSSINEYNGKGFTIQNEDTIFKEELRIIKINEIWNYEVSGVHENPILFHFTSQSENSFVCENEKNEFPKKIEYSIAGNKLTAKISDGETVVLFIFEKI